MATPTKNAGARGPNSKTVLNLPFQLKWPEISPATTSVILTELKRSLEGMKPPVRKKRKSSDPGKGTEEEMAEPLTKKLHLEETDLSLKEDSLKHEAGTDTDLSREEQLVKRSQIVVGLNEVTKMLERGNLKVGLVCLSAKPSLMHQHIQMLSASRGVPCAALHGVSETVAPALGLNSALAIGVKKIPATTTADHFSSLTKLVSQLAPTVHIPWLNEKRNRNDTEIFTLESQPTESPTTAKEEGRSTEDRSFQSEHEVKTETPKLLSGESDSPGVKQQGSGKEGKGKRRRKRRQTESNQLASPQGGYLPVNVKRTIVRPKKKKRKKR